MDVGVLVSAAVSEMLSINRSSATGRCTHRLAIDWDSRPDMEDQRRHMEEWCSVDCI